MTYTIKYLPISRQSAYQKLSDISQQRISRLKSTGFVSVLVVILKSLEASILFRAEQYLVGVLQRRTLSNMVWAAHQNIGRGFSCEQGLTVRNLIKSNIIAILGKTKGGMTLRSSFTTWARSQAHNTSLTGLTHSYPTVKRTVGGLHVLNRCKTPNATINNLSHHWW